MYLFRLLGQAAGSGVQAPIIPDSLQGVGYAALGILLYLLQRRGTSLIARDEAKDVEETEARKADREAQTTREIELQRRLDEERNKLSAQYQDIITELRSSNQTLKTSLDESQKALSEALVREAKLSVDNKRLRSSRNNYRDQYNKVMRKLETRSPAFARQMHAEIPEADEAPSQQGFDALGDSDSEES